MQCVRDEVAKLLSADQFELVGAFRECQCSLIEYPTRDQDSALGPHRRDDSQEISQRRFLNPLTPVVLALHDPAQIVLPNDQVDSSVRAVTASRLDRVALSLIKAGHEVFKFAPRHCLDVAHGLMQLEQPKALRTKQRNSHNFDRRQVEDER